MSTSVASASLRGVSMPVSACTPVSGSRGSSRIILNQPDSAFARQSLSLVQVFNSSVWLPSGDQVLATFDEIQGWRTFEFAESGYFGRSAMTRPPNAAAMLTMMTSAARRGALVRALNRPPLGVDALTAAGADAGGGTAPSAASGAYGDRGGSLGGCSSAMASPFTRRYWREPTCRSLASG